MTADKTGTIQGIQYLRGLAALGVVFCHYGSGLKPYPALSKIFSFGQNGVLVFFLISGFIIVYSLIRANYAPRQFLKFLLKRSVRIDPSYFVTILLTLALFKVLSLIPSFKGESIPFIPGQFLAHLFYYVPFTHYPFYNHIFWTLGVEFQFYLLIGTLYFISANTIYRIAFLSVFALTCFIPFGNSYYLVFTYAPVFALGISLVNFYQIKSWINIILPALLLGLIAYKFGLAAFILLSFSSTAIILTTFRSKMFFFFGQISYSLYLTHGLSFILFYGCIKATHLNRDQNVLWWLCAEVIFAIANGYLFYLLIERPSLRMSKQIFYKKKPDKEGVKANS